MSFSTSTTAVIAGGTFFLGLASGIIAGAAMVEPATLRIPAMETTAVAAEQPAEDEPGWDCRIHGNRQCGPGAVLPDGTDAMPGDYSGAARIISTRTVCDTGVSALGCELVR